MINSKLKTKVDDQQENQSKSKVFQRFIIFNLIIGYLICGTLASICFHLTQNYFLGIIILIDLAMLSYLTLASQYLQFHRSRSSPSSSSTNSNTNNAASSQINEGGISQKESQLFEFTLLGLVSTIYISTFEIMIEIKQPNQFYIVTSMFISLFINAHSNSIKTQHIKAIIFFALQSYTIVRLQLAFSLDYYSLAINALFFLYQFSYQKALPDPDQPKHIQKIPQKNTTEMLMSLYQSILSIIPEGLAVLNSEKEILYANPTLKKILQCKHKNQLQQILLNLGSTSMSEMTESSKKQSFKDQQNQQNEQNQNGVPKKKNSHSIDINNKNEFIRYKSLQDQFSKIRVQIAGQEQSNLFTNTNINNIGLSNNDVIQANIINSNQDTLYDFDGKTKPESKLKSYSQFKKSSTVYNNQAEIQKHEFVNNNDAESSKGPSHTEEPTPIRTHSKNPTAGFTNPKVQNCDSGYQSQDTDPTNQSEKRKSKLFPKRGGLSQKNKTGLKESQTQSNLQSEQSEFISFQGFGICEEAISSLKEVSTPSIYNNYNQYKNITPGNMSKMNHKLNNQPIGKQLRQQILQSKQPRRFSSDEQYNIQLKQIFNQRESPPPQNVNPKIQDIIAQGDTDHVNSSEDKYEEIKLQNGNEKQVSKENQHSNNTINKSSLQITDIEKILNMNFGYTAKLEKPQIKNNINEPVISLVCNNEQQQSQQSQLKQDLPKVTHQKSKDQQQQGPSHPAGFPFSFRVKSKRQIDNTIVKEKTNISHVLDSIFETKSLKRDLNKNNQSDKDNNIILTSSVDQNHGLEKQGSFLNEVMKKGDKDVAYIQQTETITKIQVILKVKYKNQDLVVQFMLVDVLTQNHQRDPLVFVMIQDLWQDLYQKKVEDIQQEKMKIFASLSHELRTPLNCSISMLEVLKDQISSSELYNQYIEEYLNPALFSNKLLLNQINDILDFVQMDNGKFKYSFFDFNVTNLLKDCTRLMSMQAQMKNLELKISVEEDIAQNICSDPNRIRQILLNFLSNSMKFTKIGFIELGFKYINYGVYQLFVKDTGIGITQENIQKIFAFCNKIEYQKNDGELNRQGCGLGLMISNSIAKGLVKSDKLKGGITVESNYGYGSKFSILVEDMNYSTDQAIEAQASEIFLSSNQVKQSKINNSSHLDSNIQISKSRNHQGSSILSNAQLSKREIKQYMNTSNIITEDENSIVETQNTTLNPFIKEKNKNQINKLNQIEEQTNNTPFSDRSRASVFKPVYIQNTEYLSSADVIDDQEYQDKQEQEKDNSFKILKNHYFSEEEHSVNLDHKVVHSPNTASRYQSLRGQHTTMSIYFQQQQQQQKNIESSHNLQYHVECNSSNNVALHPNLTNQNITSNTKLFQSNSGFQSLFPCQQSSDNFIKCHSEANCAGVEEKKADTEQFSQKSLNKPQNYYSVQTFTRKSLGSVKTKEKFQQQEQEGFTSYAPFNRPIEPQQTTSTQNLTNSSYMLEKQNKTLRNFKTISQYNPNFECECISEENKSEIAPTPEQILENIIEFNKYKKQKCKCPQLMIVDDNQFNVYALTKTIQPFNFSYCTASDGFQAIDMVKQIYFQNCCCSPQMIFMDIEMPLKDGYATAQEIIQFYKSMGYNNHPVIVACTAYVGQEDYAQAIAVGMDDFINKPILKKAFQDLIMNWKIAFSSTD